MRTPAVTALLLMCFLAGCSSPVPGAGRAAPPSAGGCVPNTATATFTDGQGRFGLTPPVGWTADTSGKYGYLAAFVDPRSDRSSAGRYAANVGVRITTTDAGLAGGVAGVRKELTAVNGYVSTADEPLTVANCLPAHLFGGTYTDLGSGLKLRNLQLLLVHRGSVILVTASALEANWTDHETELGAAVRSLTVPS